MGRLISKYRRAVMTGVTLMLVAVYIVALYKLQIVEGAEYYERSQNSIVSTETVMAARGNILDRYGRLLVSNRECNNILIDADELFEEPDPNAVILRLVRTVQACGDVYTDELPVTKTAPFAYTGMTDVQRTRLSAYLENAKLGEDATATELMSWFRTRYKIDNNYSAEETRIIAGVRYEVNVRYIVPTSDYVFVRDASIDLISRLMENNVKGFDVKTSYVREYNTNYAAHVLGYISMMDETEYEDYLKKGYSSDAQVGREGAERIFEDYLHGTDGKVQITRTATGRITDTSYLREPQPGNNVYLSIDIKLQEAAERAMASQIEQINAEREAANAEIEQYGGLEEDIQQLITGGAVVAVNVKTGEPLAIASYPTYDPATILENYTALLEQENGPLFMRALQGAYAPGSTFKICTAIAVLNEGIVSTGSTIKCEGRFDKYEAQGYAPTCWIWGKGLHGDENVTHAIRDSCNYFFYTVGDLLGIDKMERYALQFGLGAKTGIELPEEIGHMSSQAYKATLYENEFDRTWFQGDTLQAAIGQAYSTFTPLQIAEYCATIAGRGVRHSASILKYVRSYDYTEKLYGRATEVLGTVESGSANWDAVQLGMWEVANDVAGSAYGVFNNYYYCDVAAKTGTAQMGENITNNAIFMCYAPYDDPEIAVAVVVEKGSAGSNMGDIAKDILDAYFSMQKSAEEHETEMSLLK